MKKIALIASLASTLSFGAAATAQETEQVTFAYDLDRSQLATDAGVALVYRDIIAEARRACTPDTSVLVLRVPNRACVIHLVDETVRSSRSTNLAVHHQEGRESLVASFSSR